jgi:DNA-binding NarL/FixJ family response regulator
MQNKIRLLLVEDEIIVGEAICALLALEEDIMVVGHAIDAEMAVRKTRLLKPDVVLLDLHLPDQSGITVIEELTQKNPDTRVLILTAYADDNEVTAAFQAGAVGYLLKTQVIGDLVCAIRHAHQGQASIHPTIASIMLRKLNAARPSPATETPVSEAEMRVLLLVAQGLPDKEIARRLRLSQTTVVAHINSIMGKLQLTNRTQLALYALRQGLATLDAPQMYRECPIKIPGASVKRLTAKNNRYDHTGYPA